MKWLFVIILMWLPYAVTFALNEIEEIRQESSLIEEKEDSSEDLGQLGGFCEPFPSKGWPIPEC